MLRRNNASAAPAAAALLLRRILSQSSLLLLLLVLTALSSRGTVDAQTTTTTTTTSSATYTFTPETALAAAEDVLLKLFEETGGLRWTSRTNWLQDEQICNYQGIICYSAGDNENGDSSKSGHVKEINLADNHLVGVIPSTVFTDLPYLETLVLRDNVDLTVTFPTSSTSTRSTSPSSLKTLDVSNTNTRSLNGLELLSSSIETLHVNDLDLTGPIPDALFQLTRLSALYANNNHFSGALSPEGLSMLSLLQELFLRSNDLSGAIPTTIGNLRSLRILVLANNPAMSGAIPTEIEMCTELEILALERENSDYNDGNPDDNSATLDYTYLYGGTDASDLLGVGLTGAVPALANMAQLKLVSLQNQQLSGPLPNNFMALAPANEILEVNLSHNAITGSIPTSLSNKNRVNLYIAGNKMSSLGDAYTTSSCSNIANWMNGAIGDSVSNGGDGSSSSSLGCNAIACPVGTYAPTIGRATTNQACMVCETSIYLGQSSCSTSSTGAGSGSGNGTTGNSTTAGTGGGAVNQRAFLISFFNKMGGRYWRNSNNWLNPASNECTWFGIECDNVDDGSVTHISLPNNGLTNTVPTDIFLLPELVALDFSSNSIGFSFDGIENAKKLQKMYLVQSDLDSIDGIGNLAQSNSIKQLALASNYLQGSPADGLFDLTSLEELDISHNRFTGPVSSRLGQLSNLVRLEMFGNRFTGQLPGEAIGNLVQLEEFMAAGNSFSGTLPTQLENLVKLKTLSLRQTTSASEIGGNLLAMPNLSQLTSLQLDGNALVGTLPSNMLQETSRGADRIELLLSNNKLQGEIPSAWSNRFQQLVVDLSGNQISSFGSGVCGQTSWMDGTVAAYQCSAILCPVGTFNEFGRQTSAGGDCRACTQVQVLGSRICYAEDGTTPLGPTTTSEKELAILREFYSATHGYNWVKSDGWATTNDYCSWFGVGCNNQGHVERISMESNGLTGQPPTSLFDLTELQELTLKDSVITFSFDGIGKATKLSKLDLTGSSIDSVSGLDQGTSLVTLILDFNDLAGSFPTEFLQLGNLRYLSASFNRLEGRLPADLALLSKLETLTLYHNRLFGPLPAAIGSLVNLKVLGLSENNFDGEIPLEFNNLINLETVAIQREGGTDVGNVGIYQGSSEDLGTGLTGPLPAFDKLTNLRELFLGVNSLSGEIPANFLGSLDNNAEAVIDITSNRLTGGLPASLARFLRLSFYAAGNQLTLEVPSGLCFQNDWMDGQVAMFECDAILCPPNTYKTNFGRQTSNEATCQSCESGTSTPYYGSFKCQSTEEKQIMTERVVLEDLYQALGGDGWRLKGFWLDPDVSVCEWHGITCSAAGSVESIHLMQNGLVGNVPSSIYELPYLKEINFASNSGITMTFDGIEDATRLEFLNVGETGLKSLEGVGQAQGLSLLHAPGNDFGNIFPIAVLNIASLEVLDLSNNAVGSTLPDGLANLANLIVFSCSKCGLAGQFPQFIGNMLQLEFLDLSFNDFNGQLPASIESLSNLKHLDLSSQSSADNIGGLSGNLPSFATATQLTELYLQKNSFAGPIPSTFLSAMDGTVPITVDLHSNKLNGTLPEALSKFQVADFYAADNMISVIPSTLCALQWNGKASAETSCDYILCNTGGFNGIGRATIDVPCETCASAEYLGTTSCGEAERDILQKIHFDLNGNEWSHADGWGSSSNVCTWYGVTCHTGDLNGLIKSLDLRDNNLAGTLSERIWLLSQMTDLDLSENTELVVPNFARLADASSLQNLKLSKAQVQSLMGIGSANSLLSFHCTSCSIGGPIPDELYSLGLLESLFLNYNGITGPISGQIRSLTKLKELYLFNNKINGTIPEDIGRLENAEVISLGQNLLTGEIPYMLSFMPKLRVLSLEKEKVEVVAMFAIAPSGLRGDLPDFGRAPNLRELYLGSNSLGGTIPPHFLALTNKSASIRVDLSHNFLHSAVPPELAEFDDLRLFVGGNQINAIAPEVCGKKEWMNGLMSTGCDAFLCPPGTYNEYGRRVVTGGCEVCDHRGMALAYGSTMCSAIFPETRTEEDMLGEFFDIAGGIEWSNKTNWKAEGVSVCSWFGVKCETIDGRTTVTEISLPSNNLSGRVASIIFYLPSLRVLNVAKNKVVVSLRDIGDAMSLQELDLTLTEVVSLKGVSRARNLQVLKMGNNAFNGESIPEELYSLSTLRALDISEGSFMGEISSLIGGLNQLQVLTANKNYLGGQIPDALGKLSLLTKLDLSDNMFYGDLPSSIEQLRKLEFLGIGARNQPSLGLSGVLHSFSNLTNLMHLDLGGNLLTGTVPGDFLAGVSDPTATITVLLDSNLLHGQVPPSLSRFTRLNLDITDNKIESIASELCEMRFWNDGDVGRHDCDGLLCPAGTFNTAGRQDSEDNRCEECPGQETDRYLGQSICPSLRKESAKAILKELFASTGGENWKKRDGWMDDSSDICTWHGIKCIDDVDVEEINLGGNNLAGPVPKSVFELPSLKNLFLYSNPIQFSFVGIEKATSLRSLQLDSTGLSSLAGIGNAPMLTYLDARFNALEGTLPDEIDQLIYLETLLLTENGLFGPLPSFESNRRLITVRLAENDFTGPLPSFAVHPSLRNLDVSNNQLDGPIPQDLFAAVESTTAIFLDLSGNQFSGMVPGSLSRFVDATMYVRDNQITGIPSEVCKQERWNGGDVGRYSCDAILCPPQTFNPSTGRASNTNGDCQACPHAPFYGHSQCDASNDSSAAIFVSSRLFATVMACSSAMAFGLAILL